MVLPTNITTCGRGMFQCTAEWSNTATNGLFWPLSLLGFVIVLFISTQRLGTARSFGFATFIGMIFAWLFVSLNLITWYWASLFIVAGVVGIIALIINKT